MTPDGQSWDPHSDSYARNEDHMLDWNGHMVEPIDRVHVLISEIQEDNKMTSNTHISSTEMKIIDDVASASSIV